jgi:flavin-binding protein dodecin
VPHERNFRAFDSRILARRGASRLLEDVMAIHKVIEVISQSDKSWEDAAQRAVSDAGKTVDQIKSIWIKNFEAIVKDNKIVEYRVNANITFEVK